MTQTTNEAGQKQYGQYWSRTTLICYSNDVAAATYISFARAMGYDQKSKEWIDVHGASFINKSGRRTEGLGWYYNGSAGEAQQGLENSTICIIDLKSNTAYALVSRQNIDIEGATRVEQYAQHVINVATNLRKLNLNYLAADAYYSKVKLLIYSGCTKVTTMALICPEDLMARSIF